MIFFMRFFAVWIIVLVMSACSTKESVTPPYLESANPWQQEAHKVLVALKEGEVDRASMLLNLALQRFPREPTLHTLNGLTYEHLSSEGSQHRNSDLAEMAYQTSLNLDPNNWYTLYRMGRLQVSLDRYAVAQRFFARALELRPKDPQLFYEMAFASYYAKDLPCAFISIQKAMEYLEPTSPRRLLYLRGAALIASASGKHGLAKNYTEMLEKERGCDQRDLVILKERMERWSNFHQNLAQPVLRNASLLGTDVSIPENPDAVSVNSEVTSEGETLSTKSPNGTSSELKPVKPKGAEDKNPIVLFECVLLALEESIGTQKGQNLLKSFQDGFLLTQGPSDIKTSFTKDFSGLLVPGTGVERAFSRSISWGSVHYNANILNITNNRIETLSRPILNAFLGQPASFASGSTLIAGLSGSSGGSVVNVPVGTIITITATNVQGVFVDVDVDMETSSQTTTDPKLGLASQVMDIQKARIKTKLRLQFNETGMVGGNYERSSNYLKDGVPLLNKIPLVQYFFASETNSGKKKSILFLLTPRRPKEAEEKFKEVHSLKHRHHRWPDLYQFMKNNSEQSMIDMRDMGIFYNEKISKLAFYSRSDMVQLPDENLKDAIGSFRNFIYY